MTRSDEYHAVLRANSALPGGRRLLQVAHGAIDTVAPGHWFGLRLGGRTLRLPVLDASLREGWLAFQAPGDVAGHGRGSAIELSGPRGAPILRPASERRLVLVADQYGLPVMLFAATSGWPVDLALAGLTGVEPPLRLRPSRFVLPGFLPGAIAGIAALEDAGIPSRVAHPEPLPGCYEGELTTLVGAWLEARTARQRWHTVVAVIGAEDTIRRVEPQVRGRVGEHHAYVMPDPAA